MAMTELLEPPAVPMSAEGEEEVLRQQDKRELDRREYSGIAVVLSWIRSKNILILEYVDEAENAAWASLIPNDRGLEAMAHPNIFKPEVK